MRENEANNDKKCIAHNLILRNRAILQVSGIVDMENFNDQTITAYTDEDSIIISGENLHIKKLNLEQGELCVTGKISSLTYTGKGKNTKENRSIFSKIFK